MLRRNDVQHHSPEQVRDYFRDALTIVRESNIPAEWHEAAFLKGVDLLAGKTVRLEEAVLGGLGAMHVPGSRP